VPLRVEVEEHRPDAVSGVAGGEVDGRRRLGRPPLLVQDAEREHRVEVGETPRSPLPTRTATPVLLALLIAHDPPDSSAPASSARATHTTRRSKISRSILAPRRLASRQGRLAFALPPPNHSLEFQTVSTMPALRSLLRAPFPNRAPHCSAKGRVEALAQWLCRQYRHA